VGGAGVRRGRGAYARRRGDGPAWEAGGGGRGAGGGRWTFWVLWLLRYEDDDEGTLLFISRVWETWFNGDVRDVACCTYDLASNRITEQKTCRCESGRVIVIDLEIIEAFWPSYV
jgi:hypothetical protein